MSTKASEEYRRVKASESLDSVRVYNPTDIDYVMWYDRSGPQRQKILVQAGDIGLGKGIKDIPRYAAKLYATDIVTKIISNIADADWEKKKKKYRTRDEMLQHAMSDGIRVTDPKYWFQYFPYRKNSLNRILTESDTLESLIAEEREYRQKNGINIPVVTLVWMGVSEKFGGLDIVDPDKAEEVLDKNPLESSFYD